MQHVDKVAAIIQLCNITRAIRNDMTLPQLQAFLLIAEADINETPLNGADVREALGLTNSQAYRLVWNLGSDPVRDRGAKRQMGLLNEQPDPAHRNSKLLVLSQKGHAFYKAILNTI